MIPYYFLYRKLAAIPLPSPSGLHVFIDEQEQSIETGDFGWNHYDDPHWEASLRIGIARAAQ
jgi:hypothetical protein